MAVTKYLNKTGLIHFWGEIKAWCKATFALISHTHDAATTSASGFLSSTDKTKLDNLRVYPKITGIYTAYMADNGSSYIVDSSFSTLLSTEDKTRLEFYMHKGLNGKVENGSNSLYAYQKIHFVLDGNKLAGDGLIGSAGVLSVPEYEGATASANATSGLVPPALKAERSYFLKGDGTWGDLSSKAEDSNVVHTTGTETIEGEKIFRGHNRSPIRVFRDRNGSGFAAGELAPVFYAEMLSGSTGDISFSCAPISLIGSDAETSYNVGVRLGSTNGMTLVTAGECGASFTSATGTYNNEDIYLTTDGSIKMFVRCSNDATSYAGPVTITGTATSGGTGSTTTVTATNFIGNASTATKATQDGSGNVITSTYLPFSGGTMTGAITRTGQLAGTGSVTNSSIYICNGTGASSGGGIWLYGKDSSNAGKVRLQAYNGTYHYFDVNSDGTSNTNTIFTISKSNSTVNEPAILTSGSGQNHIIAAIDTSVTKGTAPSANKYWGISFYGKDYDHVNKRIGLIETHLLTSNTVRTQIVAYNCTTNTNNSICAIRAIVDGNGNAYTEAPKPSDTTDNSTKIATTSWIRTATGNTALNAATATDLASGSVLSVAKGGTEASTVIDAQANIMKPVHYSSGSYDFNDIITSSVRNFTSSATFANCPNGSNGQLITFGRSGSYIKQFWSRYGTFDSNDHYLGFRTGDGAGTWSSWHKLYTDSDIIPVTNGGTGATDRLNAVKNLFNSGVGTNTTDFLVVTSGFASAGYATVNDVKSVLGLGSAAYTADTTYVKINNDQDIYGKKSFTGIVGTYGSHPNFVGANSLITKGSNPSSNSYFSIVFNAAAGNKAIDSKYRLGALEFVKYSTNANYSTWQVYVNTANATDNYAVCLGYDSNKSWEFRPNTNNVLPLGTGGYKWTQLFANTATISTSDERLKNSIDNIPDEILNIWESVNFNQFKFNDAVEKKGTENARTHSGVIAQQIKSLFDENSIDINKYAFFCYDSWEETKEEKDDEGNTLMPYQAAGDAYAIRYEELLCIEAAYQRRKNKILENRISELEKQVSDMLVLLQNLTNGNG